MNKKFLYILIAIAAVVIGYFIYSNLNKDSSENITNFQECIEAGYPAMESYPRQCSDGNNTFTEEL